MSTQNSSPVRPYMTIFILVTVIAGIGGAIIYEALTDENVTLSDSQAFNIFLGAALGFAGSVVVFHYGKVPTPNAG